MNEDREQIKQAMERTANLVEINFEERTVRLCELAYYYIGTFRLPKEEETA